jgi:acetoin utilization deacetylase AcuC-like enzyme
LVHPCGHHATAPIGIGFCIFNNTALAAQYAMDNLGVKRVAILDWDIHHGEI